MWTVTDTRRCFERFNYGWAVAGGRGLMGSKESFFNFVIGTLDHI